MSSDITKCSNESCQIKKSCWRNISKPKDYQSWKRFEFNKDFDLFGEVDNEKYCDFFYPVDKNYFEITGTPI